MVPWIRDHFFGQFWKLGFCLVSECEIFAHGGQIAYLSIVKVWLAFPHNTCLKTLVRPTESHFLYMVSILCPG